MPDRFSDIRMALLVLETVAPPKWLLSDQVYDAASLRDGLKAYRINGDPVEQGPHCA